MVYKGQCEFKNLPDSVTVGTVLNLYCTGRKDFQFKENLFVEFPNPKNKYKLKILKILKNDKGVLDLEVTSYKAGSFSETFFITDGDSSLEVSHVSFAVQSTLPEKKQMQPHPSFGPWQEPFPMWYLTVWGSLIFSILFFGLVLSIKFFKRKKFLDKIKENQGAESPIKKFVKEVRRSENNHLQFIQCLEASFKIFLEELFVIELQTKKINQIMKSIKKYEPRIYKKYGQEISGILKELSLFRNKRFDEFSASHLKKTCYKLVFDLDQESLL